MRAGADDGIDPPPGQSNTPNETQGSLDARPIKLVYILGSGRCGSTILDAAIGTAPRTLSAGEFDYLDRAMTTGHRPTSTLERCSCGRPVGSCPIWAPVWVDTLETLSPERVRQLNRRYGRVLLSIPSLVVGRWFHGSGYLAYRESLLRTVRSIAAHGAAEVVVDSSKNPTRGWTYAQLSPRDVDVRYVHIVREGRTVVRSALTHYDPSEDRSRDSPWPSWATALYTTGFWVYMNVHSSLVGAFAGRPYLRIRYEDLVGDPETTFRRLGAFLDLDLSETRRRVQAAEPLEPGHIVFGNRSKEQPVLRVGRASTDPSPLPTSSEIIFRLFGGWLSRLYAAPSGAER